MNRSRILIILVFLIVISFLLMNSNIFHFMASDNTNNITNTTNISTIKVLIFDGNGVMDSSVDGIEDCLNDSNNRNLTGNNKFAYNTTDEINSKTLSGYNVLVMPGGEAPAYLSDSQIDSSDIKEFVKDGNGYLGICAEAYAGSNYIRGDYAGWGLTPDVNTISENYEGLLSISTTSFGSKIINVSPTNLHMDAGPAMYTNNSQVVIANFADNHTGYQNYAAIVGDTYGYGRVILSGPHPELPPLNPQILANMILWCSQKI